jgi:thioredoxin 1
MTHKVTSADFQKKVLDAEGVVVVDFWAAWCGPCIALGPILEQVGKDSKGKAKVMKLNVDENNDIAAKYQIRSIPNIKIFKDGEVVRDLVGLMPKEAYLAAIDEVATE